MISSVSFCYGSECNNILASASVPAVSTDRRIVGLELVAFAVLECPPSDWDSIALNLICHSRCHWGHEARKYDSKSKYYEKEITWHSQCTQSESYLRSHFNYIPVLIYTSSWPDLTWPGLVLFRSSLNLHGSYQLPITVTHVAFIIQHWFHHESITLVWNSILPRKVFCTVLIQPYPLNHNTSYILTIITGTIKSTTNAYTNKFRSYNFPTYKFRSVLAYQPCGYLKQPLSSSAAVSPAVPLAQPLSHFRV